MRQGGRYSKKTSGGSSMKKIISLLVTALMIFPMTGCAKKNASGEEEKVLPVKVMGAHEEENPILLQYLGNTNSKDNIKLSFKLPGKIAQLNVKEGDYVSEIGRAHV